MTKIDKIYEKVSRGSKDIKVSEAVSLLKHFRFNYVRQTKHTTFYQYKHHIIGFNRHKKILHSTAIKEMRNILDELKDE